MTLSETREQRRRRELRKRLEQTERQRDELAESIGRIRLELLGRIEDQENQRDELAEALRDLRTLAWAASVYLPSKERHVFREALARSAGKEEP